MPADRLNLTRHTSASPDDQWLQHNIWFPNRAAAARLTVREIGPALVTAQQAGELRCWWYVSKNPWRLRYQHVGAPGRPTVMRLLDRLTAEGQIAGSTIQVYEPETRAFGGPDGMSIAHHLFHLDSLHLLAQTCPSTGTLLGQRELSTLLCSAMMRGAGLDIFEQGDVWERVADLRRGAPSTRTPQQPVTELEKLMRVLMSSDAGRLCDLDGNVTRYESWLSAFDHAGKALSDLASHGRLSRGLRAVLAHHMIFHFNRAGLPIEDQAMLANLATGAIFGHGDGPVSSPVHDHPETC